MEIDNKSPHILSTSANLFGLCFAVFTYLKVLNLQQYTLIDEFTAAAMLLFMISCLTSFLSIRSNSKRSASFETVADYSFMIGLFLLFLSTILIVFKEMV